MNVYLIHYENAQAHIEGVMALPAANAPAAVDSFYRMADRQEVRDSEIVAVSIRFMDGQPVDIDVPFAEVTS